MILSGERIYLRHPVLEDASDLLKWENDPEVWTVGDNQGEYSIEDIQNFIRNGQDIRRDGQERFMICLRTNNINIGCIDLYECDFDKNEAGIGILIYASEMRKFGYGSEALTLLITYCKDNLKLKSLFCRILGLNEASRRLFTGQKFIAKDTKKEGRLRDGNWEEEKYYELILH